MSDASFDPDGTAREKIARAGFSPDDLIADDLIAHLRRRPGRSYPNLRQLLKELSLDSTARERLPDLLERLEDDGRIVRTSRQRFALPEQLGLLVGTLNVHPRGFAFLQQDVPVDEAVEPPDDLFIPPLELTGALHGDRVLVKPQASQSSADSRPTGSVQRILRRANTSVIGTFHASPRGGGTVIPEDAHIRTRIYISDQQSLGARDEDLVVATISRYPIGADDDARGAILSVLGPSGNPGTDTRAVLAKFELNPDFPEAVEEEALALEQTVPESAIVGRRDLRAEQTVTIDGPDAKDLDDAISLRRTEDGYYQLGVHIADVAHYVREGTQLDAEAARRGTSVYLIDTVVPMLPRQLSNQICSLNPQADRLTLSCLMTIDSEGTVCHHEIVESVICTTARLTYPDVARALADPGSEAANRLTQVLPMLRQMEELFNILYQRRVRRGALDFDLTESEITLDADGRPISVQPAVRTVANRIIEEFMLVCNETVAEHFRRANVPLIFRVHERPDPARVLAFEAQARQAGLPAELGPTPEPRDFQAILSRIRGRPEEPVLSQLLLRSLALARYSSDNSGHFGLAAPYYCHFTSPIRRYPDLYDHRVIKRWLNGARGGALASLKEQVSEIADYASARERHAQEAERDIDQLKKCRFLEDKIDEEFPATIVSIAGFGFFAQLPNTIEGLIRLNSLPPGYIYDEARRIFAHETFRSYRLGDIIHICVAEVDPSSRQIDFVLADQPATKSKPGLARHLTVNGPNRRPAKTNARDRQKIRNDKGKAKRPKKPKIRKRPGRPGRHRHPGR